MKDLKKSENKKKEFKEKLEKEGYEYNKDSDIPIIEKTKPDKKKKYKRDG